MTEVKDETPALTRALRYMTDEDHRLLLERAQHMRFGRGEVIIAEGSRRQAIYLVQQGFARVERAHLGNGRDGSDPVVSRRVLPYSNHRPAGLLENHVGLSVSLNVAR